MTQRYGLLFVFLALFVSGLYATLKPHAIHEENADVPGFHQTGFAWVSARGWRVLGIILLAASGPFLYLFLTAGGH